MSSKKSGKRKPPKAPAPSSASQKARRAAPRRHLFASEYLKDRNATKAAERCGYSPKTAYSQGARLLKDVEISSAIAEAEAAAMARNELSVDRILQELKLVGFADMAHYLKFPGEGETGGDPFLDFTALPEGATRAIQEIVQEVYLEGPGELAKQVKRTKFKLHPKVPAIELMMKHLGMLVQRRVDLPIDLSTFTEDQLRRVAAGADPLLILAESRGAG